MCSLYQRPTMRRTPKRHYSWVPRGRPATTAAAPRAASARPIRASVPVLAVPVFGNCDALLPPVLSPPPLPPFAPAPLSVALGSVLCEGLSVGESVAEADSLGVSVGESVGETLSVGDALSVGESVGDAESVGEALSVGDGESVGELDGESVGVAESVGDGESVGEAVGEPLSVGVGVGAQAGRTPAAAAVPISGPALKPRTAVAAHAANATRTCLRRNDDVEPDNVIPPRTLNDKAQCALLSRRSQAFRTICRANVGEHFVCTSCCHCTARKVREVHGGTSYFPTSTA